MHDNKPNAQTTVPAVDIGDGSRRVDDLLSVSGKERVNYLVMMRRLLRDRFQQSGIHGRRILLPAVQEWIQPFQVWIFRQSHNGNPRIRPVID